METIKWPPPPHSKILWVFNNLQTPMIFSSCYLWDHLSHNLHLACQSGYINLFLCPFIGMFFIKNPRGAPPHLFEALIICHLLIEMPDLSVKNYTLQTFCLYIAFLFNFIIACTIIHNQTQFLSLSLSVVFKGTCNYPFIHGHLHRTLSG